MPYYKTIIATRVQSPHDVSIQNTDVLVCLFLDIYIAYLTVKFVEGSSLA